MLSPIQQPDIPKELPIAEALETFGRSLGNDKKWVIFLKRGALYEVGGTFGPENMKEGIQEIRDHCDRLIDSGTLDPDNYKQYE